jgi:hypothetical protein
VFHFFYHETAYRSLEEMDVLFNKVDGAAGYLAVPGVARDEPRRYGKNGELLIDYEATEEYKAHVVVSTHHGEYREAGWPGESESGRGGGVLGGSL